MKQIKNLLSSQTNLNEKLSELNISNENLKKLINIKNELD